MDKKFYTVKEIAEATGFSPATIQNRITEGELFAVQGTKRGAYRIPASAFAKYMSDLGLGPSLSTEFLAPSVFVETTPEALYAEEIEPALRRAGFPDMPTLLRAIEDDPALFEAHREVIHTYTSFLERRHVANREVVAV